LKNNTFSEAMKKEFGNHLPRSAAFKTKEGHWAVPTQKYTLGIVSYEYLFLNSTPWSPQESYEYDKSKDIPVHSDGACHYIFVEKFLLITIS
jgi:hypothetical protein